MTVKTKIEPLETWVNLTVNAALSPEARSKAIAKYAGERLVGAQEVNRRVLGRLPSHETYVDGRKGGVLESVNPDRGVITFEFDLIFDVLRWIGDTLIERSPVVSGAYRRGHTLFADGVEIPLGDHLPVADEYSFTNMVPYSRKIELGKTKAGRAFVIQVEPRIYERTAKEARSRFGNTVKIEYTFRGIVGGQQINPLGLSRNRKGTGSRAHNKSDVRFPTVVIRPR